MHYPPHFRTFVAGHPGSERRVVCLESGGQKVWAKHMEKNLFTPWHRLHAGFMSGVALLFGRKLARSNAERIAEEKACMDALRKRGMIVPNILFEGEDYIVLSDIGPSLQIVMQEAGDDDERLVLAQQGAKALAALHMAEGWHGSASLRDMTLSHDGIGFIDFEHSSNPILPLLWQHTKDIWLLAHSVARFDSNGALTAGMLSAYPLSGPKRLLRLLTLPFLPFYLLLKPLSGSMGRDVRQALVCVQGIWRSLLK